MNNSIAKYNSNKLIIYFDDLLSNKHNSITQINQLFTLMISQLINTTKFSIQAWDYSNKKKTLKLYMLLIIIN